MSRRAGRFACTLCTTFTILFGALFSLVGSAAALDLRGINLTSTCGVPTVVDIYAPPGAVNLPVVMVVHGGGWVAGSRTQFTQVAKHLGDWGFVTVNVDYPLHQYIPMSTMIPLQVASLQCVRRWIDSIAHLVGGNAGKVGIMGHSAGGHLALTTAMIEAPGRFKAVVSWGGKYDISGFVPGGALNSFSPIHRVAADDPPTRMLHGVSDNVIPYFEAVVLRHQAFAVGNPFFEFVPVAGGHDYGPAYWTYMQHTINHFYVWMKYR